jgi:signal transduction histidine kinase
VSADADGERVHISVSDSGIGVPDDRQRDIFQEFVQLHNPERDRAKGLGLGLSIVERLSRLLDHPVRLVSQPGSGSTFSVEVPGRARSRPAWCR